MNSFFKFTVQGKDLDAFVRAPGESVRSMSQKGLVPVLTDFPRVEVWVRKGDLQQQERNHVA